MSTEIEKNNHIFKGDSTVQAINKAKICSSVHIPAGTLELMGQESELLCMFLKSRYLRFMLLRNTNVQRKKNLNDGETLYIEVVSAGSNSPCLLRIL